MKESIRLCSKCYTFTEEPLCGVCSDLSRDPSIICVVAEPKDVFTLEKASAFRGLYHVLGGVIDHIAGIAPSQLRIQELIDRIQVGGVTEVIIATNPDMEGDTTALFIKQSIAKTHPEIIVTKIARGLPMGGDIEFADEMTLGNALNYRQTME